ncbi:unnamed protein product [Scytosiphon promiscuus]
MSASQPLAVSRRAQDKESLAASCTARVLVLIDVAGLPAAAEREKGGINASRNSATVVDGLRLSILRVLAQLCLSCRENSWVEWAPRFFDSRYGGVGKTPAELKARLRSRQAAQGVRGFRKVTQASFRAFGDACLAMACGTYGDPLARDRVTALRRWAHGQKKHPSTWKGPHRIETTIAVDQRHAPADGEGSREDVCGRMYDGHDMSTHEVVVRSLLEVLQEFDDASEGDRTAAPSIARTTGGEEQKLQLVLLHSAFPHTDEDAERFALQGNFTREGAAIKKLEPPDEKALALDGLLDAHLGKAILRARSRGVSVVWQDGVPSGDTGSRTGERENSGPTCRESCVHRCLSVAGGASVLKWGRVVGSTGLLPPSSALGNVFGHRGGQCHALKVGDAEAGREGEAVVAVALNPAGKVDVHLVASPMSDPEDSRFPPSASGCEEVANAAPPSHIGTRRASRVTPWRLMGTLPKGEIWPSCLDGQGWGATRLLRAEVGHDAQLWRGFLGELLAGELAAVISLPQGLFGRESPPNSGNSDHQQPCASVALTVALLLPISGDCGLCFSLRGLAATPPSVQESAYRPSELPTRVSSSAGEKDGSDASFVPGASIPADHFGEGQMRVERTLEARGAEVRLAMQESSLTRKRRRQSKLVPVKGARGMGVSGSLIGEVENLGGAGSGGGQSGSLSQRDSASLCLTAEGTTGDGVGYDARQWRLEMASATSHGSASPRGYRLFGSSPGGPEDDEQMSSTGSSSGPKRALCQALEDVSSRSSLLDPDADSSSTPGSKDGAGWSARAPADFAVPRGRRPMEGVLPPRVEAGADPAASLSDVAGTSGATELPLSLMSEPALACLPGPSLPAELVTLADRCALRNRTTATQALAPAPAAMAAVSGSGGLGAGTLAVGSEPRRAGVQCAGARQRFVESLRSFKRRRRVAGSALATVDSAPGARAVVGIVDDLHLQGETPESLKQSAAGQKQAGAPSHVSSAKEGDSAEVVGTRDLEKRCSSFEDGLRKGVAGLQLQYRQVVEDGKRSPVEFVVCAVPEAIRQMTDGGVEASIDHATDDQQARASQVLAAVVSGLTTTPQDLSSKHRANRSAAGSWGGSGAVEAPAETVPAKPALQKIRDYQLQALLLCQLNILAMDLPESSDSLVAFCSLAANETTDNDNAKTKKGKSKKGKKKKRQRKGGGEGEPSTLKRPSDPLPDCRRTRLVDYLQPISTMLDACTVTKPPPPDDSSGGAGGAGNSTAGDKSNKGFQSRAYDGTLADFMGLALVEHFAPRLAATLGALFDDFECHPPDSLTAALAGGATSASGVSRRESVATGSDAERDFPEGPGGLSGAGSTAAAATVELHAGSAPKDDAAGTSLRAASTGGILLSDRTGMSHNHFKMSGVLNGFREVTLKAPTASGGLGPSVLSRVSGNDQGGRDTSTGDAVSGQSGGWRTSNGSGGGRRGVRSRATRDSKQAAGPGSAKSAQPPVPRPSPAVGIRQSPRLSRTRPSGDSDANDGGVVGTVHKKASGSKRPSPSVARTDPSTNSPIPARERQRTSSARGGIPRGGGGVLVGETPQKRLCINAATGGSRPSSRRGSLGGQTDDSDVLAAAGPASPPAAGTTAHRKRPRTTKTLISGGSDIPASPSLPMCSPAAAGAGAAPGPTRQQRAAAIAPTSPAEGLFVAESPGLSTGSVPRNGRIAWGLGGEGGGISRHLMAESASPVARGRVGGVVPDTPA